MRVAAAGSLSKAAAVLNVRQSVGSRNIAMLETQCGERLFHRTGRGVVLTGFGELVHPRILNLPSDADGLADAMRGMQGKLIG